MPDDLDDLVRRAMKALDDQVPAGYFEALPNRTLARLESSMQPTEKRGASPLSTAVATPSAAQAVPKVTEDSGLHDIRSLAQSTKQRLSNRRTTESPVHDPDEVASSSAGWKAAVALPEPAKMVSLPELAELPPKKVVLGKDKKLAPEAAPAPAPAVETPVLGDAPAVPAIEMRQPFARPAPKRSKAPLAIAGAVLAAAAGVAIYVATANKSADSSAGDTTASTGQPVVAQAAPVAPPPPATPAAAPAPAETAPEQPQQQPQVEEQGKDAPQDEPPPVISKNAPPSKRGLSKKSKDAPPVVATAAADVKPDKAEGKRGDIVKKAGAKGEDEPNFDDLLKEAGVDKSQKVVKPKLANKALSGDDFKRGMGAVSAKAQACYKGTQGTAVFKLTVAPSGQVAKVNMSGMFAGKPEGDCVTRAVQSATFPPWDGGPQTFTYSYLLAD